MACLPVTTCQDVGFLRGSRLNLSEKRYQALVELWASHKVRVQLGGMCASLAHALHPNADVNCPRP